MRHLLNDKRIVAGMCALALALGLARWLPARGAPARVIRPATAVEAPPGMPAGPDEISLHTRARWLPRAGDRRTLDHDPFDRATKPALSAPPVVLPPPAEPEAPIDTARLIVEALGLDEGGFFVRYRDRRVREGDRIGSETLGKIALSGLNSNNDASYRSRVAALVAALRIDGCMDVDGEPRIVLDGRAYRAGDLLRRGPWFAVHRITPDAVLFIDEHANIYPRER